MKNSILIFVLLFSFSFVSCAQSNNDLAMVDTKATSSESNDSEENLVVLSESEAAQAEKMVVESTLKYPGSLYTHGAFKDNKNYFLFINHFGKIYRLKFSKDLENILEKKLYSVSELPKK